MLEINKILKIQKALAEFQPYFLNNNFSEFNEHLNKKLENLKPVLMIYGSYNAGKSSLLNALYGKELAKTGDNPETKEVHKYSYKNFDIYDTPGLNATNIDDITSQEQLLKSDIIIFVMSSDGGSFENKYVYEKIIKVALDNKPIIIVVNNKTGDEEDFSQIKEKIKKNIDKEAKEQNCKDKSKIQDIILVNANSALKAKKEGKKLLEKNSGIIKFEELLDKVLRKSGKEEVLNSLKVYIQNTISKLLDNIDSQINDEESRKLQELLSQLQKDKVFLSMELREKVNESLRILEGRIFNDISSGSQQAQIESNINNFLNDINQNLNSMIEKAKISMSEQIKICVDQIDNISNINIENGDFYPSKNSNDIGQTLGAFLPLLTTVKVPIPWIAVAQIILSLFVSKNDSYNDQERQRANKEAEQLQQAKSAGQNIIFDIKSKYDKEFFPKVEERFNETISKLNENLGKINQDQKSLLKDKEELIKISNSL